MYVDAEFMLVLHAIIMIIWAVWKICSILFFSLLANYGEGMAACTGWGGGRVVLGKGGLSRVGGRGRGGSLISK
jgi:hypothetical protein